MGIDPLKPGVMDLSKIGKKDHNLNPEQKFRKYIMEQMDQMFAFLQTRNNDLEFRINSNNLNLVAFCRLTGIKPAELMQASRENEQNEAFMAECAAIEDAYREEKAKEAGKKLEERAEELGAPAEGEQVATDPSMKGFEVGKAPDDGEVLEKEEKLEPEV